MKTRLFLWINVLFQACSSIPVSKSHIKSYPKDLPCRVWHWDLHPVYTFTDVTDETERTFPLFRKFSKLYTDVISKGSNCSIHFHFIAGSTGDFIGFDVNGTARYNGLIGDLQDNKYDFAVFFIRPDSLPHEPVIIGPVVSAADVGILSGTQPARKESLPFMSFMANFDTTTYAFTAIAIHIIMCMCVFVTLVKVDPRRRRKRKLAIHHHMFKMMKGYCSQGFKVAASIVGQQLFAPQYSHHRILVLFFSLFCFFTISGYFLNLFSADLTVMRSPAVIDSIHDLVSETFSHIEPVILKKLWLKNLLSASPIGSPANLLYKRILRNPSVTIFDADSNMDPYNMLKIATTYAEEIRIGKMACLAPRRWGSLFTVKLFCQLDPAFADVLHISEQTFASGTLTFAFRKGVHPVLRHFLEYRFRTFNEMEMIGWADTGIKLMNPSFKLLPEYLMLQCNWFMRKERTTVLTGVTWDLVRVPFHLFASKVISAIPVLLLEIFWYSADRYSRQGL